MKVSGTLQSRKDDEREGEGEVCCYLVKGMDPLSEQSLIYLLNRFHFLSHNYHQSMEREREERETEIKFFISSYILVSRACELFP